MFDFKITKKPEKRVIHEIPILEKDLTKDVWMALFSVGTPVTFRQDVTETNGAKEIMYYVEALVNQSEWDKLNRKLGALGIDEIQTTATAD